MNILFITQLFFPHIGGVEKQVFGLSNQLYKENHKVTVLTEKYDESLPSIERISNINIFRIGIPHIKYVGLIYIWIWFALHKNFLNNYDILHFHGSFIWYWPIRILILNKSVYTTFHGAEWIFPIPFKNKLIRKIDALLATKNIAISGYLQKWYGFKADEISWTALDTPRQRNFKKDYKNILYVGRLDEDTGLRKILKALKLLKGFNIDFCGDGPLRDECEKIGIVHGFTDPNPFYKKAFIFVAPGITSIMEAISFKCLVITTYDHPLHKDYLLTNPYSKWIIVKKDPKKMAEQIIKFSNNPVLAKDNIDNAFSWVKTQNWENEVKRYLKLWGKI